MAQYRVLAGIDYPPNKRVEIGDIVTDLPGNAIKDLLAINAIEPADAKATKEPLSTITLSDGITPEEEVAILDAAKTIEGEKA